MAETKISWLGNVKMEREDCPEFDNTANFGPIRDQDGHQLCWAFQVAALAEENLCQQDEKYCGQSVSALDVARFEFRPLAADREFKNGKDVAGERFYGHVTMDDMLDGAHDSITKKIIDKVCLEKHNPYDVFVKLDSERHVSTKAEIVTEEFDKYVKYRDLCKQNGNDKNIRKMQEAKNEIFDKVKKYVSDDRLDGKNLDSMITESGDKSDFLQRLYRNKKCDENRLSLKARDSAHGVADDYSIPNRSKRSEKLNTYMKLLRDAKKAGRSVGVSIDLAGLGVVDDSRQSTAMHAVVINGVRYKEDTKTCEVHLRNSWGEGARLNGWTDLGMLYQDTASGYFIK